jgi:hypothetical protein
MMMMGGQSVFVPMATGLDELLASYGVAVKKNYVLDSNCYIARQQGANDMPLHFAPVVRRDGFSRENPATRYLKEMIIYKASSIELDREKLDANDIDAVELVKSSEKAWLMEGRINLNPMFIQPPDEGNFSQYSMAVALEGSFRSHFQSAVKPDAVEDETTPAAPAASDVAAESFIAAAVKPARIVVVGTSEITTGGLIDPQGKSPAAIFTRNIVDYLNYNDMVPEMRSKGLGAASIGRTSALTGILFNLLTIIFPPIAVAVAGVLALVFRKRRKAQLKARYSGGN